MPKSPSLLNKIFGRRNSAPETLPNTFTPPTAGSASKPKRTLTKAQRERREDLFSPTNSAYRLITEAVMKERARPIHQQQLKDSFTDATSAHHRGEYFPNIMKRIVASVVKRVLRSRLYGIAIKAKGQRFETPWGPVTITPRIFPKSNIQYLISTKQKDYPGSRGKWSEYKRWAEVLKDNPVLQKQIATAMRHGTLMVEVAATQAKIPLRTQWNTQQRRAAASLYATIMVAEEHRIPGIRILAIEALESGYDIARIIGGVGALFTMVGTGGTDLTRQIAANRQSAATNPLGEIIHTRYRKRDLGEEVIITEGDDEADSSATICSDATAITTDTSTALALSTATVAPATPSAAIPSADPSLVLAGITPAPVTPVVPDPSMDALADKLGATSLAANCGAGATPSVTTRRYTDLDSVTKCLFGIERSALDTDAVSDTSLKPTMG